jgi:hypothetical protein
MTKRRYPVGTSFSLFFSLCLSIGLNCLWFFLYFLFHYFLGCSVTLTSARITSRSSDGPVHSLLGELSRARLFSAVWVLIEIRQWWPPPTWKLRDIGCSSGSSSPKTFGFESECWKTRNFRRFRLQLKIRSSFIIQVTQYIPGGRGGHTSNCRRVQHPTGIEFPGKLRIRWKK